ncbi:MAG TPA: hypothetical protein DCM08_09430 [Microscillaceae bacterium]|jgi:serine/threonine protein kinase|nr:hypothetical protein [Microscillaceae bacterium]
MIGEQILNYKIAAQLEETAFFITYLGVHSQFGKKINIRTFNPLFRQEQPQTCLQITQELKALAKIQHPYIVTFYDFIERADNTFFFFEHIEGKSLQKLVDEVTGPIPELKVKTLATQLLDAVQFARQRRLPSAALVPSQIWVAHGEQIKVGELAFCPTYLQEAIRLADADTLGFLAPEQIAQQIPQESTPVYNIGTTLYLMLCGKQPFVELPAEEIKIRVKAGSIPPMKSFYPAIAASAQQLVEKATQAQPTQRFGNLVALQEAIATLGQVASPLVSELQAKAGEDTLVEIPERRIEVVIADEEVIETQKAIPYLNLPLFAFLALLAVTSLIWLAYSSTSTKRSELAFNLSDTAQIRKRQDSITKAKFAVRLRDSLRSSKKIGGVDSVQIYMHKVKLGETLEMLSKRYYVHIDTLRKLNDLKKIGKKTKLEPKYGIRVPVRAVHKIQRGESLGQLASLYRVNYQVLAQANAVRSEVEDVFEGKEIIIPINAKPSSPKK